MGSDGDHAVRLDGGFQRACDGPGMSTMHMVCRQVSRMAKRSICDPQCKSLIGEG